MFKLYFVLDIKDDSSTVPCRNLLQCTNCPIIFSHVFPRDRKNEGLYALKRFLKFEWKLHVELYIVVT